MALWAIAQLCWKTPYSFLPLKLSTNVVNQPISVAARSKAWVYGRSFAGIVGSNPAGGMDVCLC